MTDVTNSMLQVVRFLNRFLLQHWPAASWNSLRITCTPPIFARRDVASVPRSLNLTLMGSFKGGELWVEDPAGSVPRFVPEEGRSVMVVL